MDEASKILRTHNAWRRGEMDDMDRRTEAKTTNISHLKGRYSPRSPA